MDLSKLGQLNPMQGSYASQFNYVSIDELTEFCSVQLQACDKQIRQLTSNQQEIVNNAEQIANAQAALNDLAAAVGKGNGQKLDAGSTKTDGDATDAANVQKVEDTIHTLQGQLANASDPAAAAIKTELDKLTANCQMDWTKSPCQVVSITKDINQTDVADMAKDLQGVADKLQSDQSMNMIKVQSAVGQREQMVQLVTGLIQKMNEMVSSVVNNIGK